MLPDHLSATTDELTWTSCNQWKNDPHVSKMSDANVLRIIQSSHLFAKKNSIKFMLVRLNFSNWKYSLAPMQPFRQNRCTVLVSLYLFEILKHGIPVCHYDIISEWDISVCVHRCSQCACHEQQLGAFERVYKLRFSILTASTNLETSLRKGINTQNY